MPRLISSAAIWRADIPASSFRIGPSSRARVAAAAFWVDEVFRPVSAKPHSAGFCGLESGLCACADHFALMLGYRGEDVECQPCGVRVIARDELDAGIDHRSNERHIPRKPAQLGDDQAGFVAPAS